MRISDWSSDVCSSDLTAGLGVGVEGLAVGGFVAAGLSAGVERLAAGGGVGLVVADSAVRFTAGATGGAVFLASSIVRRPVSSTGGASIRTEAGCPSRSEEHTSELQSLMRSSYAVFCLKKK